MVCSTPLVPVIRLNDTTLEVVDCFNYLGTRVTSNGDASGEVRTRIGKASGVFLPLMKPLWGRRDISRDVKWKVFEACVLSVLFYGCETWAVKAEDCRRLSSFVFRCFRRMLRIPATARVQNSELAAAMGWKMPLEDVLRKRRLTWCGHVLRMDDERAAKQLLLAEPNRLPGWRRPAVGPRRSWRRLVGGELDRTFRHLRVRFAVWRDSWPRLCVGTAANRDLWRNIVDSLSQPP